MTVRIRIRANNPRLHNLKIATGDGEIFHGYRTNIIMEQLTPIRFQRYGLILEKNCLEDDSADKNQGQ